MRPLRQRPGRHARVIMTDQRWQLLPLAARAAWLQIADIADAMPELRQPPAGRAVSIADLCRLLAADPSEFELALTHLVERQIMEPAFDGFRLKAY
ncbi:hypothetical protein [Acetobacter estunensis]|uniref:hypothetical protein n=1 Tax=Acetobacter estunensis TaxID=104097 RepID=UPI001C2D9906|nr:hypothetical protein [Acetobacter estunensis]MBV1835639.1 hypothetical protein [Acetobacter estunensis]MBV1836100.1 hypothetical protein [Acetobacter estunensis]